MAARKTASKVKCERPGYEQTDSEQAALDSHEQRRNRKRELPRIKIDGDSDPYSISIDHEDPAVGLQMIMDALAASGSAFGYEIITQLANLSARNGAFNEQTLNFLLASMKGIEPHDEVETMLASQMAAVHLATMTFARKLANVETIQQQDSSERAFNKLARTFTNQMEALKRYRTGGEQKMTVQHVHVNEGGQAVVGNVESGARTGGGLTKK